MQECFPKHSRMGTVKIKYDKETDEDGKKICVSMERSKAIPRSKAIRRTKLSQSKYNNNKHNVLVFYKKWKKCNEIQ